MTKNTPKVSDTPSPALPRRQFLQAGLAGTAVAAGSLAGSVVPAKAAGLEIPDWSRGLGASVDDAPYGSPSEFEGNVVRRSVEWLTATRE